MAFVVAGALAAMSVGAQDAFVAGFFWVFFGSIAAVVTMIAGAGGGGRVGQPGWLGYGAGDEHSIDMGLHGTAAGGLGFFDERARVGAEPFVDANGVHRYHGDILDFENHPGAGALNQM